MSENDLLDPYLVYFFYFIYIIFNGFASKVNYTSYYYLFVFFTARVVGLLSIPYTIVD